MKTLDLIISVVLTAVALAMMIAIALYPNRSEVQKEYYVKGCSTAYNKLFSVMDIPVDQKALKETCEKFYKEEK